MSLKSAILDILFPQEVYCALCGQEALTERGSCEACRAKLCECPARPVPAGLDGFSAAWIYREPLRGAIHRFKYENAPYLADFLAGNMLIPETWTAMELVPVPLFAKREKERGYNQSMLLSKAIGENYGLPVRDDLLFRVRDTKTQTDLSERERKSNLKDAFSASSGCKGKRILLIDDVCTTGSTLSACAKALRLSGASGIYALCAAAAVLEGGK